MNSRTFGRRLKQLRNEFSLSQEALSEKMNERFGLELNKSLISRYENNIHEPKFTLIQQLSMFFNVTTDFLMGLSDSRYGSAAIEVELRKVPLLCTVQAGLPSLVDIDYDSFEYTDNAYVDFALRVRGNSMIGARIYEGDVVYVKRQSNVDNGEIAVVVVNNDEATIKRIYKEKGKIILHPENPTMDDIVFGKEDSDDIRIVGKVVEVKFKL